MPSNEEIAEWLGYRRVHREHKHLYAHIDDPDGKIIHLPDWLGDPWRWVEIHKAITQEHSVTYWRQGDELVCRIYLGIGFEGDFVKGFGIDDRQAFLSAFEAWWPERGE